ncbi:hypothetical protein HYFRA_00001837 [Hymenoscyphus fraxineus]|uniref:Uncharacterized protein n=1 Tax=Hymenoscyphus fraxineus TaxID=746836 RepID=A0A9N9KKR4_9HELO|nr:hypothetical protein HYFRA_00001837 [Hymenoscyphus fraxineus]
MAHTVYRVRQIPSKWRYEDLEEELRTEYKLGVTIHSFASHNQKRCNMNVAIVSFDGVTEKLRQNDNGSWHPLIKSARTGAKGVVLDLDINFDGFTPISDVETDQDHNIDFIVVHGWGSHAYGGFCYKGDGARTSWLHKVANEFSELRIWFYGYQSSLNDERIMSSIDTWANGFRHSLCGLRQSEEVSNSPSIGSSFLLTLL